MSRFSVFQARHGLPATGNLDRITWTALTTPFSARVRQIELTLERWRWLPEFEHTAHHREYSAIQTLRFHDDGGSGGQHLADTGDRGPDLPRKAHACFRRRPEICDLGPDRDVPRSIALREMLPELRRHPEYLQRNHLELVRGEGDNGAIVPPSAAAIAELAAGRLRLRQQPGDDNALGLIKFLFPNTHNVYLHSDAGSTGFSWPRDEHSATDASGSQTPSRSQPWCLKTPRLHGIPNASRRQCMAPQLFGLTSSNRFMC